MDNQGLKDYALQQWVNISSMTAEETEAYYGEQYDLYAGYLSDYIELFPPFQGAAVQTRQPFQLKVENRARCLI